MSVIGNALFLQVADRIAKQARIIAQAASDAQQEGGGFFYPRIHEGVPAAGNIDVENDLIKQFSDLDNDIESLDLYNSIYATTITALNRHVQRSGGFSSLDKYLVKAATGPGTSTSGVNVDDGYAHAYTGVTGSELDSVNVFGPETNIAYISFSASGTAVLTRENAVGTGAGDHTDTASSGYATGNHAAAGMDVFVASGVGGGGAATVVSFRMIYKNGTVTPSGINVSFSAGETVSAGAVKEVGTETDFFLRVSGVQIAGGANTLVLQVKSDLERVVAL